MVNNDLTNQYDTIICKILKVENTISASAGSFCADYSGNILLFDVSNEMKKGVINGRDIKDALKIFIANTTKHLTRIITSIINQYGATHF